MSFDTLTVDRQELVIKRSEPIAPYTTFGIGGPADVLVEAYTEQALQQVVREAMESRMRWLLIGGGSNLLVGDTGFRGLVNVNRIAELATRNSLVLLDELGSATDPDEGAALAVAMAGYFLHLGAWTCITTHLTAMKVYAASPPHEDALVLNAAEPVVVGDLVRKP